MPLENCVALGEVKQCFDAVAIWEVTGAAEAAEVLNGSNVGIARGWL